MLVYRIWDPVEKKFYARLPCGGWAFLDYRYSNNSNSIWTKLTQVEYSLKIAPPDIKNRLIVKTYDLVEVDSIGDVT